MSSSTKARVARRIEAKAEARVAKLNYTPGEAAKSIITITEVPGTNGGFTIGMGLHGARMEELFPGKQFPVSIVDIVALAVTTTIRKMGPEFQEHVNLVNETLRNVNTALADGTPLTEAMAGADEALAGAMADLEPANAG